MNNIKPIIFYDSWVAKMLLMRGYSAITIMFMVLTKYKEQQFSRRIETHETIHVCQWAETTLLAMFLSAVALTIELLTKGTYLSASAAALSPLFYYLWYVAEYAVGLFVNSFRRCTVGISKLNESYYGVAFEEEAYTYQSDYSYPIERKPFAWVKFLGKFRAKRGGSQ